MKIEVITPSRVRHLIRLELKSLLKPLERKLSLLQEKIEFLENESSKLRFID